jgi:hypothetical protein
MYVTKINASNRYAIAPINLSPNLLDVDPLPIGSRQRWTHDNYSLTAYQSRYPWQCTTKALVLLPSSPLLSSAPPASSAGASRYKQALQYRTPKTFKRVIALTNRPLSKEGAYLSDYNRLNLYSGIDLTKGVKEATKSLGKISGIDGLTHVYFTGIIPSAPAGCCKLAWSITAGVYRGHILGLL